MAEQHSSEVKLIRCIISKIGKEPKSLGDDMIAAFDVHESIESPFMTAFLTISDSKNFLNNYPIEGGESISIELKSSFGDAPIVYNNFVVDKITSRIIKNKIQVYVLNLTTAEALINEGVRVMDPLTGNAEAIVKKMLGKEYLASTKDLFSEPSRFEVRMNPSRDRPFDIIAKLLKKSVSAKTDYKGVNSTNTTETAQQIKGSAGFFFWETRRGFMFFSVDAICDDAEGKFSAPRLNYVRELAENSNKEMYNEKISAWGPYEEKIANSELVSDQRFLIKNAAFVTEVDLLSSFRKGKYSSLMVFFNHSTGQYEEYVYKIKDSYENMAHLGGQESVSLVPASQKGELSDFPTRVMTMLLDHEAWYNEPGIANPEDNKATDPNKFADWQKYYASQGAARAELLKNQVGAIEIPGNPLICAGDKVDIRIASKLADELRKTKPYDEESSGVYLVKETRHLYNFLKGVNGSCDTKLTLMRDSYGVKDIPSNHGNK